MVPLLLIRMKVMIAMSSSGTLLPDIVSENTSLGLGQGTVVDMRTVMYEIRKLPKTKVSLSRKIHIIGLPHGTSLNTRWSDDTSPTMLCQPWRSGTTPAVPVTSCVVMAWAPRKEAVSQGDRRADR